MLAPITSLVGECGSVKDSKTKKKRKPCKPWHWEAEHQQAFDDIKATFACEVTLAFPDYSQTVEIYCDGSKTQLGTVITQMNRPIPFFSCKLTKAQQNKALAKLNSWPL